MTKYRHAPLVELIAELRWNLPNAMGMPPGFQPGAFMPAAVPFFTIDQGKLDQFTALFSEECFKRGIHSVERLIPPGFPLAVGQVSTRLRKSPAAPELYQVGPGVFTANAVPPYSSWSEFSPFLENGIEMLLASRIEDERDEPFSSVSLQYVDAFDPHLTQGMPASKFIRDVLGFGIDAPSAIQGLVADDASVTSNLQMRAVLSDGLTLNLALGEGVANNVPAIVMQTNIAATGTTEPSAQALISIMHRAQAAQHTVFQGIVKSIQHLMEPY